MNERGMAVEFLGVPGTGKTTVARRVAVLLGQDGLQVDEPTWRLGHGLGRPSRSIKNSFRKSLHVAREMATHPWYALRSAAAVCATRQPSPLVLFKMAFNWLLVSSMARRRGGRRSVDLLDQGLFQALWSIGLEAREGAIARMGRVLEHQAPVPDLVVVLEAGPGTITRRLRERGGNESRADHWDPEDAAALARSTRLLEEVKSILRDRGAAPDGPAVLLLPNDEDEALETNALRLAREIHRLRGRESA